MSEQLHVPQQGTTLVSSEDTKTQTKLAFLVRPGLDSFLNPVVTYLSQTYQTKKFVIGDYKEIQNALNWADICWFEWCDNLLAYASKLPQAVQTKIICRLHSYEAFTAAVVNVNWRNVDRVIFVGEHIKEYVLARQLQLNVRQTAVIANGIDLGKFTYRDRQPGYKIAYVGYINHKKGPMLLLHAFKALHDRNPNYHLHIAGAFQDIRYQLYFAEILKEWNLAESVHFDGWQNDVNQYLEDKDYIMSASPLESQHLSIMEAMAKGIKPLIHHFYGAASVYDAQFLWSDIQDFVHMVTEEDYVSSVYRGFIEKRYALSDQMQHIGELVSTLRQPEHHELPASPAPLVTIGIVNYNYSRFLDEVLQSALSQTYHNLEVLVVDDKSTDDSAPKILSYMQQFPQVRGIFHAENTGTEAAAIKDIFREAKGDYLILINADDFLPHKHVIADYLQIFSQDDALEYVYGDLLLVNERSETTNRWTYKQYSDEQVAKLIYQRGGSGVIPMAGMFKLDYYRKNNYDWVVEADNTNAGDTLNCLVNIHRGWRYKYHPAPILCHRRHGNNLTFNISKRIKSVVSVMEYIIHNFDEHIYLPQVSWNRLDDVQSGAAKHYAIGSRFWKMRQEYANTQFVLNLSAEKRAECLEPLKEKVLLYFQKSLHVADTYREEISKILGKESEEM